MPRHIRFTAAVVTFTVVASVVWQGTASGYHSDFDPVYTGTHALVHGVDPYAAVRAASPYPLYYPLTAPVLLAPLGLLSHRLAATLFCALGAGALAAGLADRPWRLWILVSAPAVHALMVGQWSVWLTAAALLPSLGFFWAAKPSVGLAYLVGWPRREAVIGGAVLVALTFLVWPGWVGAWLGSIQGASQYVAPILRPGGVLGLLAWLRWRRPEARWLGMLTLIPHTVSVQEMLPLLLLARTRREMVHPDGARLDRRRAHPLAGAVRSPTCARHALRPLALPADVFLPARARGAARRAERGSPVVDPALPSPARATVPAG